MRQGLLFDVATFFVHGVAQNFGRTLVSVAHFLEYILQGGEAGFGKQPGLQESNALARGGCVKGASGQYIEGGEVWGFIFWVGHCDGSIFKYPYIVAEALKFSLYRFLNISL